MSGKANGQTPKTVNVDSSIQFLAGHQQVGEEFWTTLQISVGMMTMVLVVPIAVAKDISRRIRDAAETAEVQVIKPVSPILPG